MAESTSPLLRGNFIEMCADGLRLLMPQTDVGTAVYLEQQPRRGGRPGLFENDGVGGARPLMALSANLTLLHDYPADRFVTTPINMPEGIIDFGWSEVSVLIDVQLRPMAVPAAMLTPDSPITEFIEIDGQVAFLCDRARLMDFAFASKP